MRNSKKVLLTIFAFICVMSVSPAQEIDQKYLLSLLYLKTNEDMNKNIKKVFRHTIKFKKKERIIDFNLSERIDFLGVSYFKNKIDIKKYNIEENLLMNSQLYKEKYFFESYNNPVFSKLISPKPDAKLYLTFSKPTDNYLIAELTVINPENFSSKLRLGQGMQLLFLFDSKGLIKNVLWSSHHHN